MICHCLLFSIGTDPSLHTWYQDFPHQPELILLQSSLQDQLNVQSTLYLVLFFSDKYSCQDLIKETLVAGILLVSPQNIKINDIKIFFIFLI